MSSLEKKRQEILNDLADHIQKKLSAKKATLVCEFAKRYFMTVSYEELSTREIEDLYGLLMSHWSLIELRKPGESKVRIYNPCKAQHGWESKYTVIEISHDDMPFLVDSLRMEVNRNNFLIHLVIHLGGINVVRDKNNKITSICSRMNPPKGSVTEAPIFIEIDCQTDNEALKKLEGNLQRVLKDVSVSVEDWPQMRDSMQQSLLELEQTPPPLDKAEISESKDFLRWLADNNFTFIGCRDYKLIERNSDKILEAIKGTGLGVLRDGERHSIRHLSDLPVEAQKLTLSSHILIFAKTKTRSTIHRPAYTDYIGVKRFNDKGEFIGERRFIGLYTSSAYNGSPETIPFLRHKVKKVLESSSLSETGHAGKSLLNILETLPRDDLFQATSEELLELSMGILHLQDRQRIRLFVRKDSYGRFFSCLVFVPRQKFDSALCEKMRAILLNSFNGQEVSFEPLFSESLLACVHFVVRVDQHVKHKFSVNDIEKNLIDAGRLWEDDLQIALSDEFGEAQSAIYFNRYSRSFPASYREDYSAEEAVQDIKHIELLSSETPLNMNLYQTKKDKYLRFKVFQRNSTIPLSDALPILENMGLRVIGERPHQLSTKENLVVWINDFDMLFDRKKEVDVEKIRKTFQEAFSAVWMNDAENDPFNHLVLSAELNWHEVCMLRAYSKYFRQVGINYSESYIAATLRSHPAITQELVKLFRTKFDPALNKSSKKSVSVIDKITAKIDEQLEKIHRLDQDRILRRYKEIINATLRTNYFQWRGKNIRKTYLSLKINSQMLKDIPLPKPMFEIFVYSPRFEGVHLRCSKVARGGLRWSDRPEDFRTEVLGLMKAQQVKNACIVPSGAKGGFVPKNIPENASRDEMMELGIGCYREFIQALLDITDNVIGKKVVRPKNVVVYDEPDPYLVVAADKGTATFSDIANEIAQDYGFWLDDAFASGGSTGYDHKKMGITARGAWESVKRHFRELGTDIQTTDFTAVGIGDMSGDVFGNGMLLSQHIRLIAAFNHQHIFIDPNPNAEKSFKERQRLFALPRSGWADYDLKKISKGGGVFNRSDKLIAVSAAMKKLFGIKKDYIVPNDLIKIILTMDYDLLWNGGIGTFVKASNEDPNHVSDRNNEGIRVDASDLRCKVVGEGGNLGLTQLARVEYALHGGRIYTDFIDNAAGVDCSDHEVNIKVLLNTAVEKGKLTVEERNALLAEMTEEISQIVLKNNYKQTLALSLIQLKSDSNLDLYSRYMFELARQGKIDMELERLPNEKTLIERKAKNKGLTRPELAILFSYTKNLLEEQILASDVPEDPFLSKMLREEFPKPLRDVYQDEMEHHILRREIIATQVTNTLVNEMGFTFILRLQEETGASMPNITRAFTIAQKIFGKQSLWHSVEQLDYKVKSEAQFRLMRMMNRLIRRATRWLLRNRRDNLDIEATVSFYAKSIATLANSLADCMSASGLKSYQSDVKDFVEKGVPEKIASRVASFIPMFSALDIVDASLEYDWRVSEVAKTYFMLGEELDLYWLREEITKLEPDSHWGALLRTTLRDDLDWWQRMLTVAVLQQGRRRKTIADKIEHWLSHAQESVERWQSVVERLKATATLTPVILSVAMRELSDVIQMNL
jgi:glutamate dehydrogenase